jgi:regulator of PEP synthase PpsR (kinase-PPPase family)
LEYSRQIMNKLGCAVSDVPDKAVEETAGIVRRLFYRRQLS